MSDLIPVIAKISYAFGRDLTPEALLFYRARAAIGGALTEDQRVKFMTSWRDLADFMETEKGKVAISAFISSWMGQDWSKEQAEAEPQHQHQRQGQHQKRR